MSAPDGADPTLRAGLYLVEAWQSSGDVMYAIGFGNGEAAGRWQAERETLESWSAAAAVIRGTLELPNQADLDARREVNHEPCSRRCLDRPGTACARCIHAEAWQRRGGRPHLGLEREVELAREVRV